MVLKVIKSSVIIIIILLFCQPTMGQNKLTAESKSDSLLSLGINEMNEIPLQLEQLFAKGNNYYEQEKLQLANECFDEYIYTLKSHLRTIFALLSDSDRSHYWNHYLENVIFIQKYALAYSLKYPILGDLAYDCELMTKGILLESSLRLKSVIIESGNKKYIDRLNDVEEIKKHYAQMQGYFEILETDSAFLVAKAAVSAGQTHQFSSQVERAAKVRKTMNKMAETIIEFEEAMNIEFSIHKTPLNSLSVSWKDIQNALSARQAAVEFVARNAGRDSTQIIYYAIVINKRANNPIVVPLFMENTFVELLKTENPDYSQLYKKLWAPIENYLIDVEDVYLSSTGILNGLPFAALQRKGDYLIDCYNIFNLLSTRDIIKLKEDNNNKRLVGDYALFIGGADFGVMPKKELSISGIDNTDCANDSITYRGQGFDYLPQSKREVVMSSNLLNNVGWSTKLLTDTLATKNNLIQSISSKSPTLLHIATHGFYFPTPQRKVTDLKIADIGSVSKAQYTIAGNPLMRCGLLFSGANHLWSNKEIPDSVDDGVISGIEILGLNLHKTELAVVAACNTAVGDIDYAEGVRGIQRALRIAGAKRTIVTLWEIPDKESSEFMQKFYSYLSTNQNISTAFHSAQKYMLKQYPMNPRKWAGFILVE